MNPYWKKNLRRLSDGIPRSNTLLKFDFSRVPVSILAKQYYCEVKVEHQVIHGEIPKVEVEEGIELHNELLKMKKTTIDDILKSIEEKEHYICSFPLFKT